MKKQLFYSKAKLLATFFFSILITNIFSQTGVIDPTFTPGTAANNYISESVVLNDGKILISGNFTSYNGTSLNRLAKLNSNGTVDGSFNIGTGANNQISAIAVQNDGKIIVGGSFTSFAGNSVTRIARLNSNGSFDATFSTGSGFNSTIYDIAVQNDGKIIIAGNFTNYNGTAANRLVRLNSDGSIDGTFNIGTAASSWVYSIIIQNDNKIIIGGGFASFNGVAKNKIVRLNTNGSIDGSFTTLNFGGSSAYVYSLLLQNDGKIVVAGGFNSYNSVSKGRIIRLNTDGSLDAGFTGTGANNTIYTTAITDNNKIIVGGAFTTFNGTTQGRLTKLLSNGTIDTLFSNAIGTAVPSNTIYTTRIQSNQNLIIGGGFTSYNGTSVNRITRINNITDTKLRTIDCNSTLTAITSTVKIACNAVPNATNYEWQFTDVSDGSVDLTKQRGAQWTDFYLLGYFPNIEYNKVYNVRVRAFVSGTWGSYGDVCTLTTPTVGLTTTELTTTFCNTTLTSLNNSTKIKCNPVTGATDYEWQLTSATTGSIVLTKQRGAQWADFYLKGYFPGIQLSTTYSVQIRPKVNGTWGTFGTVCTITTPASFSKLFNETDENLEDELKNNIIIDLFPNPISDNLNINFNNLPNNTTISITNLLGQSLRSISINELNNNINISDLENGIYNVNIYSDGTLINSKKIIKQ